MNYLSKLNPEQIKTVQEMSHNLWGADLSLEDRYQKLINLIEYPGPILTMSGLYDEKGNLVASLKRYKLSLRCLKKVIPIVGLGSIFTHESFRHRGFGKQLIDIVLNEERQLGSEAAILFSDINPDYYQQFQFLKLPALSFQMMVPTLPKASRLTLAEHDGDDQRKLIRFYEASFGPKMIRPYRSETLWSFVKESNFTGNDYILSLDGQEVGYLSATQKGETLFLDEACYPPELDQDFLGLLRAEAPKMGFGTIRGWHREGQLLSPHKTLLARPKAVPMIRSLSEFLDLEDYPQKSFWFGSLDHF